MKNNSKLKLDNDFLPSVRDLFFLNNWTSSVGDIIEKKTMNTYLPK